MLHDVKAVAVNDCADPMLSHRTRFELRRPKECSQSGMQRRYSAFVRRFRNGSTRADHIALNAWEILIEAIAPIAVKTQTEGHNLTPPSGTILLGCSQDGV